MLSDRDYSNRTYQERLNDGSSKSSGKMQRNDELWRLYGKEHKTIIDKLRIKMIERKNIKDADR